MTLSTGLFWPDWWRRRLLFPEMLRIVMTTTLIRRSTPRPLNVMPRISSAHETITIVASNKLKASMRNVPEEANDLRIISMKNTVRNTKSIVSRS